MIDALERTIRVAGVLGLVITWVAAGSAVARNRRRPTGPGVGLARRFGAPVAYALAALPYFTIWALLWRPLPGSPPDWLRLAALTGGTILGAAGLLLYLWGRFALADMYNVSSSLGTELYADHRLVITGPYRYLRHPMYAGIVLAALGGIAVYRTWTMVFALASAAGLVVKAVHEERLLADEFGADWQAYVQRVSGWWPRPTTSRHRSQRSSHV